MTDSTQAMEGPPQFCVAKSRVIVVEGPDQGLEVTANDEDISVGTSLGNTLRVTDPTVSRHHLSIELTEAGIRARDLAATNGTRFQGRRVSEIWLQPGDRLQLGRTVIEIADSDGELRQPLSDGGEWGEILGRSRAMRRLFAMLPPIAASDSTALLCGETGCGKSLVAQTIHDHSPRRDQPFVVLDCGAIPSALIESELFGHEKGAFTGADQARLGAFRAADGGTLFLEEIGELPLEMQPRLLRALEERVVSPVGSDVDVAVDIRVVAASNRDLRERVNSGHFRADLFYRLNILRVKIPPLRERREDIDVLARHFYRQLADHAPPPALIDSLAKRDWPGNVRELRGAVERAIVFGGVGEDTAPSATLDVVTGASFREAKEAAIESWERDFLSSLMKRHDGNLSAAARAVRTDRNYLRERLVRLGIANKSKKSPP